MRKQLIILITVLLAVFLAIGCTSTDTEDQPTSEENMTGAEEDTTGAEENLEEDVTGAEEDVEEDVTGAEEDMMEEENDTMEEEDDMMENDSMEEENMTDTETMEGEETMVSITEDGFEPFDAQITVGDTITWTNDDSVTRTIIDDEGVFDSEDIEPGESYSYTFEEAGTFTYGSGEDETFEGTITVVTSDDETMNESTSDSEVVVVPPDA